MRASSLASVGLLLVLTAPVTAQVDSGVLSGRVVDAGDGEPVRVASVFIRETDAGAQTDDAGAFQLDVPAGSITLVVQALGYRPYSRVLTVSEGESVTLDIGLVSDPLRLNPIQVTVGRKPEKVVEAPATTHVIAGSEVAERPSITVMDHVRAKPGMDLIQLGVGQTSVVARGFQNLFSGSLHVITDNRIAGLPSLQVNLLQLMPQLDDDIDHIELVLGPGSALYGPRTAEGVMHVVTKSPLDHQGTTLSATTGNQGLFSGSFWTSHRFGEGLGLRLSGAYLEGEDWPYVDPVETEARVTADADPGAFVEEIVGRGFTRDEAILAQGRVGLRDERFESVRLDARGDWEMGDGGRLILSAGRAVGSGLQTTSVGTSQVNDWALTYYQARLSRDRLFLQAYLNQNEAGDTYSLRDGTPFTDRSRMFVAQAQYGFELWDGLEDVTFGVDWFQTNPRTGGSLHGVYEDRDDVTEIGGYLQSETALGDRTSLILTGRLDYHSALDDPIFSPRAAVVFTPVPEQSFRATFNRAFTPPRPLDLYADFSVGGAPPPLGQFGFDVHVQGGVDPIRFSDADGGLAGMRSPFHSDPGELLPVDVGRMWQYGVGYLFATGAIDAATADLLSSFSPGAADVGINTLDVETGASAALAPGSVPNIPALREGTNSTWEIGYQGLLKERVLLSADVWYSERNDIPSPLVVRNPLLLMNADPSRGADLSTWLIGQLVGTGMEVEAATCTALVLSIGDLDCDQVPDPEGNGGLAAFPAAIASSPDVAGADLILAQSNAGNLDLWGADIAVRWLIDDIWSLGANASWVSDDFFADPSTAAALGLEPDLSGGLQPIALNAPTVKAAVELGYGNPRNGVNADLRVRYHNGFPVRSGVFVGSECITGGTGILDQPCVDATTLVDLTFGYALPRWPATLQVAVTNLFDEQYRNFVGVPVIRRLLIARLKFDVF